ncbi:MAG TPA: CtsR family transcriptional regulator [Firmicutes bacterium]|nr:CtsR family transcriptional regulator [Bacillota bacterium]
MPNLTDYIEDYLKKLLALSSKQFIEIRRRELAGKFDCVPSQINYVLERRFPPERGYLVESRRGGGGCIRIYRIKPEVTDSWQEALHVLQGGEFELPKARQLLQRMIDEKIISRREAGLLTVIIQDEPYRLTGLDKNQYRNLQRRLLYRALEELLKVGY